MIDLRKIINKFFASVLEKYPPFVRKFIVWSVEKVICLNSINNLLENHKDKTGISFIDELFEYLDFSFVISQKDREKIPSDGRLLVIANHPLGALDALALLKAISIVRADVKIIANEILLNIENIKDLILPYNIYSLSAQKDNVKAISQALENEEAVILFPAAEVSRIKMGYIKDGSWHKGILYFAKKHNVPVLPIFIKARNSLFFYFVSGISKKLSTVLLPREIFHKKSKNISMVIGDQIPSKVFQSLLIDQRVQLKLLKKHLYLVGKKKSGIFATEKNIIFPVDRKVIKKELQLSKVFGSTTDGKKILLTDYDQSPEVIKEIARLRELTFRKVGEGTGKKLDIDEFDKHYKHLVLWDDDELEIVGSYRIGVCNEVISNNGIKGLYTSTLFNYSEKFISDYLPFSVELGRSFIQKKYWNSPALDYLWQGIGTFLSFNDSVKYMMGPVSISSLYPEEARRMLVYFFNKWFGDIENLVKAKNSFLISQKYFEDCRGILDGVTQREDYRKLKSIIKHYGFSIPPLYKHYTELCEPGGVKFLDFGVDKNFKNCVDGFIVVEIEKIKNSKKERYLRQTAVL